MLAAGVTMTPKQQQQPKPQPKTTIPTKTEQEQAKPAKKILKAPAQILMNLPKKREANRPQVKRVMPDLDQPVTQNMMKEVFTVPMPMQMMRTRTDSTDFDDATTITDTSEGTYVEAMMADGKVTTTTNTRRQEEMGAMEATMTHQKEEAAWMGMTKAFIQKEAGIKQPRGQEEAFKQKNDIKMRNKDFECMGHCDTTGTATIQEVLHEDGVGTEEEAPADEDGEGARVAHVHTRDNRHHMHTIGMDMDEADDRDRTGPDERDREPEHRDLITMRRPRDMEEPDIDMHHERPAHMMKQTKKIKVGGDTRATCVHCQERFRPTKMHVGGKLCANCNKIHESVKRTVEMHEGTFKMVVIRPGKVHMKLKCAEGHEWTIGMQSRKAKNWCKVCKDHMREEMHRRHFEHLQQMRTTQLREQDILFNEERHQAPPDIPVADQAQMDEMQELLVTQIMEQNRAVDPQVQFRVAELFLNVDEGTIIDFMQRMEETSQTAGPGRAAHAQGALHQLVQRLRLCLHPDKNREHPRAAEAFARM